MKWAAAHAALDDIASRLGLEHANHGSVLGLLERVRLCMRCLISARAGELRVLGTCMQAVQRTFLQRICRDTARLAAAAYGPRL